MDKPTLPTKLPLTSPVNPPEKRLVVLPRELLHLKGIAAALTSALFMGLTPVFGKQAIQLGMAPIAVVAIRTTFAAFLMLLAIVIFSRQYLYIYPAGMAGCLLAGFINGLGSLFFYSALGRIDAGVGQLLYSLYPLFLALWLVLDHQPPSKLTVLRGVAAIPAVYLLSQAGHAQIDWIGVLQMLVASALYALHIPINQRVLYDMPAPTVTLYTLIAMSIVVVPAYFISGSGNLSQAETAWAPLFGLTMVTFLSRLTLFLGVKHLGGMQTALLGLSELLVTLFCAQLWLNERFSLQQWAGASLLVLIMVLVIFDRTPSKYPSRSRGWLSWLRPPGLPYNLPKERASPRS